MTRYRSRVGIVLSALYLVAAGYVVWDAFRHTGGGWINLRWLGVALVTTPSQVSFGLVFDSLELTTVNFSQPGWRGYGVAGFHVGVSAAFVYLVGYGIEWLVRRLRPRNLARAPQTGEDDD